MVAVNEKTASKLRIEPFLEITENSVFFRLPIKTVSEANNFEHWTKKHRRHRLQQKAIAAVLSPVKNHLKLPCHIKMTRIGKKKIDRWDNLPMSMKYILDICCAIITGDFKAGRGDDNPQITVSYDQKISPEYGVEIEIKMDAVGIEPTIAQKESYV